MSIERMIALALPHSAAAQPHDGFHVSVFLVPKLTADAGTELSGFPTVARWGSLAVAGGGIELALESQEGVIAVHRVEPDPVDARAWEALFPADTPIAGEPDAPSRAPDWSGRDWASYPVAETAAFAKSVLRSTIMADPVHPVAPSRHPMSRGMLDVFREVRGIEEPEPRPWQPSYPWRNVPTREMSREQRLREERESELWRAQQQARQERTGFRTDDVPGIAFHEDRLTRMLDEARTGRTTRSALADLAAGASAQMVLDAALRDLHEARRFYEEPDRDPSGDRTAVPPVEPKLLPQRKAEFHERVAAAGDHPLLLRRLGLVIDVVAADPAALRRARWLRVRMTVPGASDGLVRSPRVAVAATSDDALVSVAAPGRADDWSEGLLALGEPDRFAVVDVDPDGAALKTGNFLWQLPRTQKAEANGDPADAAAPALRGGLAIARTSQRESAIAQTAAQTALQDAYASDALLIPSTAKSAPDVFLADITRGIRVEVFDAATGRWRSLHRRLSSVLLDPRGAALPAYRDAAEDGFLQGTAAVQTPGSDVLKVHESVFGWDGWGLSAPRPGNRIRPEVVPAADGDGWTIVEHVEPQDAEPADAPTHPLRIAVRVEPGSLPRLRYGRRYAFRAWTVDLAGNVRPHALQPQRLPRVAASSTIRRLLPGSDRLDRVRAAGGAFAPEAPEGMGGTAAVSAEATIARLTEALGAEPPTALRAVFTGPAAAAPADLAAPVRRAAAGVGAAKATGIGADRLAEIGALIGSHLGSFGSPKGEPVTDAAARALRTVSPLRPFLRWEPVSSPAVVPTSEYTAGESLRVLVVRSDVTQSAPGAAPVITTPDAQFADRHLAPPKTSQHDAELHGMFDGSLDGRPGRTGVDDLRAIRREELAWALREPGSFFDRRRAPLTGRDDPWLDQPGIRLVGQDAAPGAASGPAPVVPAGDAPKPGAYVVHATDAMEIPYLPDPAARGVALQFLDAGAEVRAARPRTVQLTTVPYQGSWPEVRPLRLRLSGGDALAARATGRDVHVQVPPGMLQRFLLSSTVDETALERSAVWDDLDDAFTADPVVRRAALDGLLWALTPSEPFSLVHAVPRPVVAPSFGATVPWRQRGAAASALLGVVRLHGASTAQLTLHARWTEVIDAGAQGRSEAVQSDVAFTTRVDPSEQELVLFSADVAGVSPRVHDSTHRFADTRHRRVEYVLRASTRFREYFPPPTPRTDADWPGDDGTSVLSAALELDVPSSAPPPAPVVRGVLPLFRWEDAPEPAQPFARRRIRRGGLRIHLERGWFASGDGELLGILLGTSATPGAGDEDDVPYVSQWGADPVWDAAPVAARRLTASQLMAPVEQLDPASAGTARPVATASGLSLRVDDTGATAVVAVKGYRPRFSAERGLWYVDVAFEGARTFWPFVRLALARYQPSSLQGCELSTPVRADFAQIVPERTLTVGRPGARRVSVQLRGESGHRKLGPRYQPLPEDQPVELRDEGVRFSHRVLVRLQRRNAAIGGDLGWDTISVTDLPIAGHGDHDTEVVWFGEVELAEDLELRRPLEQAADASAGGGGDDGEDAADGADAGSADPLSTWRVRVEEWERIPGDPEDGAAEDAPGRIESRIVYADDMYL